MGKTCPSSDLIMKIQDLKKEMELAGYNVTIEVYPYVCGIEMILFEKFISVDRVKITLTGRGWVVIDSEKKDRGKGFDDWYYYLLERDGVQIELQSLLFANTCLSMKDDNDNFLGDEENDEEKLGNS